MSTYRATLRFTPSYLRFRGVAPLDSETLLGTLPGVIAHEISSTQWGEVALDVTLKRPSPEVALNDLFGLAQRVGYTLVNGEISKVVSAAVEGAVLTAAGGGALGTTSENGWITAIAACGGSLIGALVGSQMKRVEVGYQVRPNFNGGWTFTLTPAPGGVGFQGGPAPA